MKDAAVFGRRLRHVRMDRGMSQAALAAGVCSASAISRWESGISLPPGETVLVLAHRLGIAPSVLTGEGFDSRLAQGVEGVDALLCASYGEETQDDSLLASWLYRVQVLTDCADPWVVGDDPRPILDELSVDPITDFSPGAAETVKILSAMTELYDDPHCMRAMDLAHTVGYCKDVPMFLRVRALENVVSVLLGAGFFREAREAVVEAQVSSMTATVGVLWGLCGLDELVGVRVLSPHRARDAVLRALSLVSFRGDEYDLSVAQALVDAVPGDALVFDCVRSCVGCLSVEDRPHVAVEWGSGQGRE